MQTVQVGKAWHAALILKAVKAGKGGGEEEEKMHPVSQKGQDNDIQSRAWTAMKDGQGSSET